jgi:DNA polymerase-3 subunit delta
VDEGLVEIDLKKESLTRLFDETRSLSLFATSRLIIGFNAEAALPGGRSKAGEESRAQIAEYFEKPTPGVVVVFESTKFDKRDRDDKAKAERVVKFYAAAPEVVELDRLSAGEALKGCVALAKQLGLDVEREALADLVEMLAADMARLENELQKLSVYVGERPATREDIELMVPEARESGIFELTDALARKDRGRALEILDTLAKTGSYWPLQITYLASLFRQTLAVQELGGSNPRQVSSAMSANGFRVWPSRMTQLSDTARKFSRSQLEDALIALFEADRDLRRERPNDRLIMERLVLRMTA